jgi:hypothetical protein
MFFLLTDKGRKVAPGPGGAVCMHLLCLLLACCVCCLRASVSYMLAPQLSIHCGNRERCTGWATYGLWRSGYIARTEAGQHQEYGNRQMLDGPLWL